MRPILVIGLLAVLLAPVLGGCGVKGPPRLPADEDAVEESSRAPAGASADTQRSGEA